MTTRGIRARSRNVSESTGHDDVLNYFRNAAFALLADRPDAMVQERLLILFEQGNKTAAVEPDITIALGVGRHPRNSYKIWVEGRPPDLVVEGLSNKTWRRDVDIKPALYRDLGVREYWQVDPIGRIREPVVAYRLRHGVYEPIVPSRPGVYRSDVLDADVLLRPRGDGHPQRAHWRAPSVGPRRPAPNGMTLCASGTTLCASGTTSAPAHETALARIADTRGPVWAASSVGLYGDRLGGRFMD